MFVAILSILGLKKLRKWRPRLTASTLSRSLTMPLAMVALALLSAGPARCDFIANGTPTSFIAGGQAITGFVGAEPFTVNNAFTLTSVEFEFEDYPPAGGLGTLDYFIYSNNGFFPGTLLESGSNPVSHSSYLLNGGTTSVYVTLEDFNLNTPLNLSPGTYWVALNFTNSSQFVVWQDTVQDTYPPYEAGAPAGTTNWGLGAVQLYLGISDTPLVASTPEPASITLAGLALVGIAWFGRRRLSRGPTWLG
jgi:PEP-CTERM motif